MFKDFTGIQIISKATFDSIPIGEFDETKIYAVYEDSGSTDIDLSNYYTKEEVDTELDDKLDEKIDKQQNILDAGKVLGIGEDGRVKAVPQSGGGSSGELDYSQVTRVVDLREPLPEGVQFSNLGYKTPGIKYKYFWDDRVIEEEVHEFTTTAEFIEPAVERANISTYLEGLGFPIEDYWNATWVNTLQIVWNEDTQSYDVPQSTINNWAKPSNWSELQNNLESGRNNIVYLPSNGTRTAKIYNSTWDLQVREDKAFTKTITSQFMGDLTVLETYNRDYTTLTQPDTTNVEILEMYTGNSSIPIMSTYIRQSNHPYQWQYVSGSTGTLGLNFSYLSELQGPYNLNYTFRLDKPTDSYLVIIDSFPRKSLPQHDHLNNGKYNLQMDNGTASWEEASEIAVYALKERHKVVYAYADVPGWQDQYEIIDGEFIGDGWVANVDLVDGKNYYQIIDQNAYNVFEIIENNTTTEEITVAREQWVKI